MVLEYYLRRHNTEVLKPLHSILLIPLTITDTNLLYEWQTNYLTRKFFRNPELMLPSVHSQWIKDSIESFSRKVYIAESKNISVGCVRLDFINSVTAEVSIYINPEKTNRGYGYSILYEIIKSDPHISLLAEIHKQNFASQKIFRKAGFDLLYKHRNKKGY